VPGAFPVSVFYPLHRYSATNATFIGVFEDFWRYMGFYASATPLLGHRDVFESRLISGGRVITRFRDNAKERAKILETSALLFSPYPSFDFATYLFLTL
jgi:hypothetical protein